LDTQQERRRPKLIRIRDVMSRTGLSRGGVYKLEAAGRFPARVGVGDVAVAWCEREVEGWIRQRLQVSRKRVGPRS
jgi:prophage regulatory protein